VTLRAFALLRGVSLGAVQRAIRDGRLAASVGHDLRGRPVIRDPGLAMEEWAAHSRPRLIRAHRGNGRGSPSALADATLRERLARAEAFEFETARKKRDVVDARAVEISWSTLVVGARTALLGIPSRLKQRVPHLGPGDLTALEGLLHEVLAELAGPASREPGAANGRA
jgi:phage terminase Nu1 subunit (DNA packaging protein)